MLKKAACKNLPNPLFLPRLPKGRAIYLLTRNIQGFTLVEALVLLGLLMIITTGTLGVFSFGLQNVGEAKHTTAATYIAKSKMETIKNTTFEHITTLFPEDVPSEVQGTSLPTGSTWIVTYPDGTSASPLTVAVTVSWLEKYETQSVQLTTLLISPS